VKTDGNPAFSEIFQLVGFDEIDEVYNKESELTQKL